MPQPLSLVQQERLIKLRYPKARTECSKFNGVRTLRAEITLQVAPIFEPYQVAIGYMIGLQPAVFVTAPKPVEEAHGIRTPHLNYDGSLCLYDPDKKQWSDCDAIAHTTIPWTLRWLFHYENWLSTGVWLGDSVQLDMKIEGVGAKPISESSE